MSIRREDVDNMVTINGMLWIAGAGAGILLLIVLLVVFVKRKKKSPDVFEDMEGHEFEYFCADLLADRGFTEVEVTKGSGDYGIDILAEKDGVTYAIQCKNYAGAVGNTAVQEAYAGAEYYGCDIPVVVCPTDFTIPARELAESTGVELWDGERLSHMMRVSGRRPHHDPRRDDEL